MDSAYFDSLNNDNKILVNLIETHIQNEICIEIDTSRSRLACEMNSCKPRILVPDNFIFSDESFWHELTHIQRFCIMEVPSIVECPNTYEADLQVVMELCSFDNEMEHLVIVPNEIGIFPAREKYWESRIQFALDKNGGEVFGEILLRHWLFTNHVLPNSYLVETLKILIDKNNLTTLAGWMIENIPPLVGNKECLIRTYFEKVGIATNGLCFEYLDCKSNSIRHDPL